MRAGGEGDCDLEVAGTVHGPSRPAGGRTVANRHQAAIGRENARGLQLHETAPIPTWSPSSIWYHFLSSCMDTSLQTWLIGVLLKDMQANH